MRSAYEVQSSSLLSNGPIDPYTVAIDNRPRRQLCRNRGSLQINNNYLSNISPQYYLQNKSLYSTHKS
jgi:hypothetical protein